MKPFSEVDEGGQSHESFHQEEGSKQADHRSGRWREVVTVMLRMLGLDGLDMDLSHCTRRKLRALVCRGVGP